MKKSHIILLSMLFSILSINIALANVGPGVGLSQSTTPGGQSSNVLNAEDVDYNEKQVFTTKTGVIISIPRYVNCQQGHITINDVTFHDWSEDLQVEPLAVVSFMVRGLKVETKFDIVAKDALGQIVDKQVKTIGVEMDMNSKGKMVAKASYDPYSYTIDRNKGIATVEVVTHTEG